MTRVALPSTQLNQEAREQIEREKQAVRDQAAHEMEEWKSQSVGGGVGWVGVTRDDHKRSTPMFDQDKGVSWVFWQTGRLEESFHSHSDCLPRTYSSPCA